MGKYADLEFLRATEVPRRRGTVVFREARLAKAADILGRSYSVENEARSEHQPFATASREDQDSRLIDFAERGDVMSAVILARTLYCYDLAEARAFVEGLIND